MQDNYKYLGLPQANMNYDDNVQISATAKWLQKMRQVLRTQINAMKKIQAMNT